MPHDETSDFQPTPIGEAGTLPPSGEERLDGVIADYLRALQSGEEVDPQKWLAQYPELAAGLTEFFADRARIERMARPVREAGGGTPPVGSKIRYIGDYELLDELGRGGMGVVYKARQVSLKRLVALKMILSGSHASEQDLSRFRAEAEAVARLQHPNIVQIHEIGEHEGHPYAALEYVEGGSLAERLNGTPLPAQQAAKLVEVLARAVEAAHQKGIVHRDLKPANILLSPLPDEGEVAGGLGEPKITDFGLAKLMKEDSGQTRTGAVMGTPSYMAPEQAAGRTKELGPGTDIYALGAILYELLTGRPPFRAETPFDTIRQVISEEVVAPSQLQSKVPRDLQTICLKCLQKQPARRYASAQDLAADLHRFLKGEPILARPVGGTERILKWVKRHPARASLLATLAVLAVAGPLVALHQSNLRDAAQTAREYADDQRKKAEKQTDIALEQTRIAEDQHKKAVKQTEVAQEQTRIAEERSKEIAKQQAQLKRQLHEANVATYKQLLLLAQLEQERGGTGAGFLKSCAPDLRHWEHDYLQRQGIVHRLKVTTGGGGAERVALSSDKRIVATAGLYTMRLWDAATGKELHRLKGEGFPTCLTFHPTKDLLLSGGIDKTLILWDASIGKPLRSFKPHKLGVSGVAFSPDGAWFVTASADKTVKLWDTATGMLLRDLRGLDGEATCVTFDPAGKRIAAGGAGKPAQILIWDAHTGEKLQTLTNQAPYAESVRFTGDGNWIVAVFRQVVDLYVRKEVKAWDATGGKPIGLAKELYRDEPMECAVLLPGAKQFVSDSGIWDVRTGQRLRLLPAGGSSSLAASEDGQYILSGTRGGIVNLFHLPVGDEAFVLPGHTESIACLAVNAKGTLLASGSYDKTIRLWDLQSHTGKLRQVIQAHKSTVTALAFSPDGRFLVSGSSDRTLRVWDVATATPVKMLEGHEHHYIMSLAFSTDGKRLLSAGSGALGNSASILIWDFETGEILRSLKGHRHYVSQVAFNPDCRQFVSASWDRSLKIWDTDSGKELATLSGHTDNVHSVAWSITGTQIASASSDRTVRVWDSATRKAMQVLKGHSSMVNSVLFSPDGKRLFSVEYGQTAKVWDTDTGQELLSLGGHKGPIYGLAYEPQSRTLFTGATDKTIRMWTVTDAKKAGQ